MEALKILLKTYADTNEVVSQQFYQGLCEKAFARIEELEAEMLEISNQLMDLYDSCQKTAEPKIYGSILGLHERLEKALKGDK